MAPKRDDNFFQRLTRLFRSGPSIRRKIKGYDDTGYYDKKAALNTPQGGMLPFRKGSTQNSQQFSLLGGSDMMSRMLRYQEFAEMEYSLHPDTRIAVPGGYKTIKELADECTKNPNHTFFVYSYDHNQKKLVVAIGQGARKTCHEKATRVVFDNGTELIGSFNHRLMKRDGTYVEIRNLRLGDAMMPFYRKDLSLSIHKDEDPRNLWVYTIDKAPSNKSEWRNERELLLETLLTNRIALNEIDFSTEREDITFWSIVNLCEQVGFKLNTICQHFDTDPNTVNRKLKFHGFENFEVFATAYSQNYNPNKIKQAIKRLSLQDVYNNYNVGDSLKNLAKKLNKSAYSLLRVLIKNGYPSYTEFTSHVQNPKVVSITPMGKMDLYDLTVEGYKNFATDSVISHNTPIISKTLDIQADEACSGDEKGKNFHIYSENANVKAALDELFYDILNVDFNLRAWFRNLVKYGDLFLYNEVAPGVGVINVKAITVNEIERDEGYDAEDPYAVRFKWSKYGQKHLENWQVTHMRILGNDLFLPYGTSILESARRIWRQYVMMIDAMLIYRLVRSPERRVFYVDVGTVAVNDIPNYMATVMATIKGNMAVDQNTGRMDERFNPTDVLEDYVIPVRGATSGTKIETLAGGVNQTATEDIELIQSQLFAALGVPKAYLGYDDNLSSKATLAQEDIRFSRTIQVLQKIVISELNKLAILHLYAKGFEGEDLIDFELRLSNPSSIALQQKLDLWSTKIAIIAAVDQIETKFLPRDFLYKEILGFTPNEIEGIEEKLKEDKQFTIELDSITEPKQKSTNTVDPFDGSSYGTPGGFAQAINPSVAKADDEVYTPPPQSNDSEIFKLSLGDKETPIKDNPQASRDKKNSARRSSDLEKQANQPDFHKMLHPSKNPSLRDVYDSEFLKNPLKESIRKSLNAEISKDAYLSKEMKCVLERFDKANRSLKNALPPDIHILKEETEPVGVDELLDKKLDELIHAEIVSDSYSPLQELEALGLDIKDDGTDNVE